MVGGFDASHQRENLLIALCTGIECQVTRSIRAHHRYNCATLGAALAFQVLQLVPAVAELTPDLLGFKMPGLTAALMLAGVSVAQLLAQMCVNRGFTLTTASRGSTITVSQVNSRRRERLALVRAGDEFFRA